jgi:ribosomal protein L7/L12
MNKLMTESFVNILSNPNTNFKAIALEVARKYPATFLKCAQSSNATVSETKVDNSDAAHALDKMTYLEKTVYPYIKSNDRIAAIKAIRTITGVDLLAAKHACDSMQAQWKKDGLLK